MASRCALLGSGSPARPGPTSGFRRLVGLALVALVVLVAAGCSNVMEARSTTSVDEGQRLYKAECASCHGEKGERIPIAPLDSAEFLNSRGDATLMTVIAEGKGVMPAFGQERGGPFGEAEVRAVLAYISATAGRTSSSVLADAGRETFQANCTRCHGEKADRIPAAPLNAKGFLDSRTDAELVRVITEGKGLMPAWAKGRGGSLADDQIRAVVAYLRYNVDVSVAQRARQGRELYVGNCLACHGERGDRVPAITLASSEYLSKLGDGALIAIMSEGKGVMPGFGRVKGGPFGISETAALLAYLKSWAGLSATSALSGPEQASTGRDLFLRNCTPCHGESGDRVPGVQLKSQDFLRMRTDRVLRQTIVQGNAKGMPAWGQTNGGPLSDAQIDAVLQYLTSTATPGTSAGQGAQAGAPAAPSGAPAPPSPALVSKGKEIFVKTCAACHGETRDKIPTCKLADKDWLAQKGDAGLVQAITNGKPPMMPAWGKSKGGSLADEDIQAVAAYLQDAAGLKGGAAPAAAASPPAPSGSGADATLVSKGKQVFTQNCVMCHGETRDKVPTCKLADKDWLAQKGDDGLFNAITKGKPPMMPTWEGKIPPGDIKAIVAYLKDAAGAGGGDAGGGAAGAAATPDTADRTTQTQTVAASDEVEPTIALGRELFTKNCVMCHGENGLRIPQCRLGSKAWVQNISEEGLRSRITNGKPGAGMPSWGKAKGGPLSSSQITAIIMYLNDGIKP
ncbi:MAG: c-type cytochrome [Chloroflexi bacterium]|nr:c-type cytochrome [Chloroflexota bacterium]